MRCHSALLRGLCRSSSRVAPPSWRCFRVPCLRLDEPAVLAPSLSRNFAGSARHQLLVSSTLHDQLVVCLGLRSAARRCSDQRTEWQVDRRRCRDGGVVTDLVGDVLLQQWPLRANARNSDAYCCLVCSLVCCLRQCLGHTLHTELLPYRSEWTSGAGSFMLRLWVPGCPPSTGVVGLTR
jgi:hypothetical protein